MPETLLPRTMAYVPSYNRPQAPAYAFVRYVRHRDGESTTVWRINHMEGELEYGLETPDSFDGTDDEAHAYLLKLMNGCISRRGGVALTTCAVRLLPVAEA